MTESKIKTVSEIANDNMAKIMKLNGKPSTEECINVLGQVLMDTQQSLIALETALHELAGKR